MGELRRPLFIVAAALLAVAVILEIVGGLVLGGAESTLELDAPRPGLGIPYLALVDGLLLFIVLLVGSALLVPERVHGRLQGILTLIVTFLTAIAAFVMIIVAFVLLMLMVGLLLAFPFGPAVYAAIYGGFNRSGASITLGTLMTLKLAFAICLVLAHQRFLQNKGLVLLILTSIVANIIVAFLHGIVPRLLVSVTDAVAAIILGIIGLIWAIVLLIGSIPAVVKALRVDRAA